MEGRPGQELLWKHKGAWLCGLGRQAGCQAGRGRAWPATAVTSGGAMGLRAAEHRGEFAEEALHSIVELPAGGEDTRECWGAGW